LNKDQGILNDENRNRKNDLLATRERILNKDQGILNDEEKKRR